jgi:putative thiamine transport system ATP-binding protein
VIVGSENDMGTIRRLELSGVGISLHGRVLVPPLSLAIDGGRVAVLMGPSGSGKSSLLAHLCGTLDPVFDTVGRATLGGADLEGLPPERRRVGILFQDDLLFPHLSVAENLAFGLPAEVRGKAGRMLVVERALEDADLGGLSGRDPATLSGGQRARVALMRTLLAEPAALLLDEPFSKLDVALRARFRAWVFDHARRRGLPTLLVTHDPADGAEADGPVIELA